MRLEGTSLLSGVIEGFYGRPWSRAERLQLLDWMQASGLNAYLYAPKDDLKQRSQWRETYPDEEAGDLRELISACQQRGIHLIYALSPGLDIRYTSETDRTRLIERIRQMLELGCGHFALLFDDIPDVLNEEDLRKWGSLAAAQSNLANTIRVWLREQQPEAGFLFCPTPYCGRMAARNLGGEGYLQIIGRELDESIDVFWTGREIISPEITPADIEEISALLQRPPVIWDNLHANDYDGRRFYCGPYSGRSPEIRERIRGILINPNCELPLNYVPVRTLGEFVRCDAGWNPREAYVKAMSEWHPHFETCGQTLSLEDLVFFGDCYYLPCEDGFTAAKFFENAKVLLGRKPGYWGDVARLVRHQAMRLRDICVRLSDLRDRNLFSALYRRVWELREEMDLLEKFIGFKTERPEEPFRSDFHLPGTYRGSIVARFQELLPQQQDGSFIGWNEKAGVRE